MAKALGVTRSRVHQIEQKALSKLRHPARGLVGRTEAGRPLDTQEEPECQP
jgi:hypothetical protein